MYDSVYICERMIDRKMLHHSKKNIIDTNWWYILCNIFDKNLDLIKKKLTPSALLLSRVVVDDDDGGLSLTIFVFGYCVGVDIFDFFIGYLNIQLRLTVHQVMDSFLI